MQSFADLGVSDVVVRTLAREGINEPFAVQRLVIADILAGRDVLARSPTGSGKTLAFGIPLVDRIPADGPRPAALILAPTRELATQITSDLRAIAHARALRVTAVYGGVGLVQQAKHAAASHILVATPGRLEDLLARRAFSLDAVQMLILDEADRMLDMGFKPAVDRIVRACPQTRQTLFFSATLDGEAGAVARRYTTDAVAHEHGPTQRRATEDVEHRFVALDGTDRLEVLVGQLEAERDLALVFVRTKHGADRLVKRLGRAGVDAVALHGNKSQRQRERALAAFASGTPDTLVATDVAARGIDIEGVSHVINFDPPHDHESYVHRIGRTGRAGRQGVGITLVDAPERRDVAKLADVLGLEHGLTGRPARVQRAERPERSERTPRSERPQRAPQSDRPERAPRSERPQRPEHASRSERPQRPEHASRSERPQRSERPHRPERPQGPDGPRRRRRRHRSRGAGAPSA
jgi:superfamily II DNA/RNA helicase